MISPAAMQTSGGGRDGNRRRFLLAQLQAIEGRVTPAPAQQLVVATSFDDCPILNDENAVSVHHGMQAVADHDRGPAQTKTLDGALNLALGFAGQRGSCLVEQADWTLHKQSAR